MKGGRVGKQESLGLYLEEEENLLRFSSSSSTCERVCSKEGRGGEFGERGLGFFFQKENFVREEWGFWGSNKRWGEQGRWRPLQRTGK